MRGRRIERNIQTNQCQSDFKNKNIYVNECMIHLCMFVFDLVFVFFAGGLWSQIDIAQSYDATSLYPVDDVMNNVFFFIIFAEVTAPGGR